MSDAIPDYAYASPEDPRFDLLRNARGRVMKTWVARMGELESENDKFRAENERLLTLLHKLVNGPTVELLLDKERLLTQGTVPGMP